MLTCMWSIQTAPSTSSSLYISSNRFMMSLISARHSPYRTFFSIFWYKYYVVCTIPLCMCRTFLLHFFVSCVLVRDALLPLLHFITGDFFLLNYCPCKTHCRTTGRACGFLLVLKTHFFLIGCEFIEKSISFLFPSSKLLIKISSSFFNSICTPINMRLSEPSV